MFKEFVLVSVIATIIALFFGEKASDLIATLYGTIIFAHHRASPSSIKENVFTKDELKLYNGIDKPQLYLALLGNVFDVTRGAKHYGPNQQYNVFVGCDASRSFITGKFDKGDISEEVADFNHQELRSINHWLNFYKKDYVEVGKLVGKYFDENGNQTPYGQVVKTRIEEAEQAKDTEDLEKKKFPPCNVEWDAERGTRVWCSEKSGGISRNWIGVPRQLYEAGTKTFRCACINENNEKLGNMKEYEGCAKNSESCYVKQ